MGKRKVFTDESGQLVYSLGAGAYEYVSRNQMLSSAMPKVITGNGAPTIVPERIGDVFVDVGNKNTYLAQGVSTSSDWALVDTDAAAVLAALITTGSGAPVTTPASVGLIYVDTSADNAYIAVGTVSSADWALIDTDIAGVIGAIVSTGSGVPTSTPTNVGQIYIDTAGDLVYLAVDTSDSGDWQLLGEKALRAEELTATGDVDANTRQLQLNHIDTPIVATIAAAPANELMSVRNTSASGTEAHSVVLTSGTWDGINNTIVLDAPGEEIIVLFDENGDGQILYNKGGILRVEELTVTGEVNAATRQLELNHIGAAIVATIAVAPAGQMMRVKNTSASGTETHSAVLSSGTWDGSNTTLVLDRPGVEFLVLFDESGNGKILQISISAAGAPAFVPLFTGQLYVDETADKAYIAVDTSSSADWKLMLERADLIETGAGAPGSTPSFEGQIYIDTSGDVVYVAADTISSGDWKLMYQAADVVSKMIQSGAGAPGTTPNFVGEIYVDTSGDAVYIAADTSGSGDWKLLYQAADVVAKMVLSGAGAPGTTPSFLGQIYVDITGDAVYMAADIVGSGDWKLLYQAADVVSKMVQSGAGAPSSTPNFLGEIYIDTTNDEVYQAVDTASSADWQKLEGAVKKSETLTVTGGVNAKTRQLLLDHSTVAIVATITAAPAGEWMMVKNTSSSGAATHTVVLSAGTWNGSNGTASLDAPDECIVVWFDDSQDGTVVANVGGVTFS